MLFEAWGTKVILAGDVGATKILLEAGDFRSGAWTPAIQRRYLVADFDDFPAVIARFWTDWQEVRPARARITAAAIGAAGPLQGKSITLTSRAWKIDSDTIFRKIDSDTNFPKTRVLNDLAAAAHGLASMGGRDVRTVQPGRVEAGEPRVILGVGTGLGVAYLVPNKSSPTPFSVLPGEGGHVGFSPASAEQAALWQAMFRRHGRVEAEQVCSGAGLANIYEFLQGESAAAPTRRDGAWIAESAARGDATSIKALDLFAECLGNIAADHALATLARGGVYLAGGVIAKLAPSFNVERFRSAFAAKGVFSTQLMKIPVKLVTNERIALIGAASVAAAL